MVSRLAFNRGGGAPDSADCERSRGALVSMQVFNAPGHPPITRAARREQRPQRPAWLVFALLLVIIAAAVAGLGPPWLIQQIIDDALPAVGSDGDGPRLDVLILVMVGMVAAAAVFGVIQSYFSNVIGQTIMYDLRRKLFRHITGMSLRWFTANRTGEVLSRVSNDVGAVQGVISDSFTGIVGNAMVAGSTFALMLFFDWRLALFSIAFLPVFIIPARRVGNAQRALMTESQEELARLNSQMQETLSVSGALLMKTFGRRGEEIDRFDRTAGEIRRLNVRRAMVGRFFMAVMGLFAGLAPAIVYWYGGHRVIGGEASLGTVVATATLLARMFGPVNQLLSVNITVLSSLALFERLFDYLDLEHEIKNHPGARPLEQVRGEVVFEDVRFGYRPDQEVIKGISFRAEPGQLVALVGHSGAGKTTAAYLLPRLYDVGSGSIRVDGEDVREVTLESLVASIGTVSQESYLFHESLRANLQYGSTGATDAEIERAARAANIHDFIEGLPYGYDTVVGERGYRLSGGEKQRVAIARALLKDPAILILDEATSSVDTQTERLIQVALDRLTRGRTVIAIAHRLSTVLAADQILVFEDGCIVERGTHPDLIASDGVYANLYRQQFSEDPGETVLA